MNDMDMPRELSALQRLHNSIDTEEGRAINDLIHLFRERESELKRHKEAIRVLRCQMMDVADYLDQIADADCDQDGFIPNEEMVLLGYVNDALTATADLGVE